MNEFIATMKASIESYRNFIACNNMTIEHCTRQNAKHEARIAELEEWIDKYERDKNGTDMDMGHSAGGGCAG